MLETKSKNIEMDPETEKHLRNYFENVLGARLKSERDFQNLVMILTIPTLILDRES